MVGFPAVPPTDQEEPEPPRRTTRRYWRSWRSRGLGLGLASLAVGFGLLEAGLRIGGFIHYPAVVPLMIWNVEEDKRLRDDQSLHRESVRQLWEPRPGASIPWGPDERVNERGWRGRELPREKRPGVLRIATLGDSSTFGFGVAYADTYSARLESELAARGLPAEVLDAGVIGFTVEQGLERYRELVRDYRPDWVVAAFGAINDHIQSRDKPDREKIALRGSVTPLDRGCAWARRELRCLHLAGWIADRLRGEDRAQLMAELSRLRKEQRALEATMGRLEWTGVRRVSPERFEACLGELAAEVAADGARLILISMPRHPEKETEAPVLALYNAAVERVAQRLELPFFDARAAVRRELESGKSWEELFNDYYHPNAQGHALLARALAERIAADERARGRAPGGAPGDH
jgi:lysophospholipase L1-like esterase